MKKHKIQNRSQKNSQSSVPLSPDSMRRKILWFKNTANKVRSSEEDTEHKNTVSNCMLDSKTVYYSLSVKTYPFNRS
jgi:hypothetical protein